MNNGKDIETIENQSLEVNHGNKPASENIDLQISVKLYNIFANSQEYSNIFMHWNKMGSLDFGPDKIIQMLSLMTRYYTVFFLSQQIEFSGSKHVQLSPKTISTKSLWNWVLKHENYELHPNYNTRIQSDTQHSFNTFCFNAPNASWNSITSNHSNMEQFMMWNDFFQFVEALTKGAKTSSLRKCKKKCIIRLIYNELQVCSNIENPTNLHLDK